MWVEEWPVEMFHFYFLKPVFTFTWVEEWSVETLKGKTSEAELFGSADVEPLIMSALLQLFPEK